MYKLILFNGQMPIFIRKKKNKYLQNKVTPYAWWGLWDPHALYARPFTLVARRGLRKRAVGMPRLVTVSY